MPSVGPATDRADVPAAPEVVLARNGGDHASLLVARTRGDRQREGIGAVVVAAAAARARAAGCEWLHVDFWPGPGSFYVGACGFRPTDAGRIPLSSLTEEAEVQRLHTGRTRSARIR